MNLFTLDTNPEYAATMLIDQHVNKMILETAQILDGGTRAFVTNLYPRRNPEIVKIPRTQLNNPVILSARSRKVWEWARAHLDGLLAEFSYRWGRDHAYADPALRTALDRRYATIRRGMTDTGFRLAMPSEYKTGDKPVYPLAQCVKPYRRYYLGDKMRYGKRRLPATWTRRPPPAWVQDWWHARGIHLSVLPDGRSCFHTPLPEEA